MLGKVKPKLPTGLVKEVKQLPESREMATIRFHMVPCSCGLLYEDRAAWKARPDKQVQEWIQSKVLHVTYGWAVTNQTCRSGDKEEFLVGCAKTPVASLDGVLSRSDACGVFVSRIAKESSEKHLVQWIDCGSLDSVSYLKSVYFLLLPPSLPLWLGDLEAVRRLVFGMSKMPPRKNLFPSGGSKEFRYNGLMMTSSRS